MSPLLMNLKYPGESGTLRKSVVQQVARGPGMRPDLLLNNASKMFKA
jgi:hypothetical protein